MNILYIGIDLMLPALNALLAQPGCRIIRIVTCSTDNKTEFNTGIIETARRRSIPCSVGRITEDDLRSFQKEGGDTVVCAGYYYRIPVLPGLKMINIHPSFLPYGRGVWPMPQLILNQYSQGGVTIHRLTEEMDAGPILLQESFELRPDETLVSYMETVNRLLGQMIPLLVSDFDRLYEQAKPQTEGTVLPAPEESDWTIHAYDDPDTADRRLRAFYGYECIYEDALGKAELIYARMLAENEGPRSDEIIAAVLNSGQRIAARQYRILSQRPLLPVSLDMRADISRMNKLSGIVSAAYAFESLYIWSKELSLSIIKDEHFYAAKCGKYGDNTWFVPCGEASACRSFLCRKLNEPDFRLMYVTDIHKEWIEKEFPGVFTFEEDPGRSEYVSEIAGHMALAGHMYKNVRNHWNKAQREHTFRIVPVDEDTIWEAHRILEHWAAVYAGENDAVLSPKVAYRSAEQVLLRHMRELNAELYLVYMDGQPHSVVGGYPLSSDMFDIAIAKEADHVPGTGYASKHLLMELLQGRYEYVNLEEDLGLEGLRRMKTAFVPVRMINMYSAGRTT